MPALFKKGQSPDIIPVFTAERSIYTHIQPGLKRVLQACRRFFPISRASRQIRSHQPVMYPGISGIQGDLDAVQAGFIKGFTKFPCQHGAIGIQSGNKPAGMPHQLRQIAAHGGFTAGKGKLANTRPTAPVNNLIPFLGRKLFSPRRRLTGGIAIPAFQAAVPVPAFIQHRTDHEIHTVRGRHITGIFTKGKGFYVP